MKSFHNLISIIVLIFLVQISSGIKAAGQSADGGEKVITTSDNVKLSVKVSGTGPAVFFIHGGPGQGSMSFEKMGGSNLEKFATMIYLDQRGSGKSPNAENYHLERLVEDIEEVRKSLGFDKIYLLAHSFGGIIAVNYARKYPERVSGLILAAATLYMSNPATLYAQIKYADGILKKPTLIQRDASQSELLAAQREDRRALSQQHLGYKFLTDDVKTIEKMDELDQNFPRTIDFGMNIVKSPEIYSEYYTDYTKITPSINVPVLILTGKNDHAIGAEHYRSFHFPRQIIEHIPGGHLFYYEENQIFVEKVSKFINRKIRAA